MRSCPDPESSSFLSDTNLNSVYSVNAIDFHPKNTFLSCGSDGVVSTWDKESRHRLTIFEKFKTVVPGLCCPVSDAKFSKSGRFLVYAVSYDWSKGCEYNDNRIGNHIYIHTLEEAEITPKQIAPRR
jgi:mRNA export factor